ncbi:MAG: VanZ family protein [Flavobacteriaceae bacterium]
MALTYTVFVFVISLIKINKSISVSISNVDKLVHVGIYFLFTVVWFIYFVKKDAKSLFYKGVLKASVLAFVTGIIIEFLQNLNPNARSGDVKDVIANVIGIALAVLCLFQIKKTSSVKFD